VQAFQSDLERFLEDYPDQSIGTFAAYVSKRGIPHGQALSDVLTIRALYRR
jgi:hypothetical protein